MDTLKSEIFSIKEALNDLGARDTLLSKEEKKSLDENGFVILENILDSSSLENIRYTYEKLMKKEGFYEGRVIYDDDEETMGDKIAKQFNKNEELHHEQAVERVANNLVNKGEAFEMVYTSPKVLAAVNEVIKDEFKLSSLSAIEAIPGEGRQEFQSDEEFQCVWFLDDLTEENGSLSICAEGDSSKERPLPENEVLIKANAGSVCLIKKNVWYRIAANQGNKNRRIIVCHFTERNKEPKLNQLEFLRRKTYLRISPAARYILNV